MKATARKILLCRVQRRWSKLRKSFTKEAAPRAGYQPKALSNACLRALLVTGAPLKPHSYL